MVQHEAVLYIADLGFSTAGSALSSSNHQNDAVEQRQRGHFHSSNGIDFGDLGIRNSNQIPASGFKLMIRETSLQCWALAQSVTFAKNNVLAPRLAKVCLNGPHLLEGPFINILFITNTWYARGTKR